MKSTLYLLVLIAIGSSSCGPTYVTVHDSPPRQEPLPPQEPVQEEVSYQTFYDDLSPYGQWIDYPGYGYVWMPNVDYGFKPYATNGHWVYSDAGWVWASDYNWGWAAFHYGRWFYDNAYGWMWVPGYEWAPAWVSWRRSNDYYGWAPLSPGISLDVSFSNYNPPHNYWCFVPHQYVTNPRVNNYYVSETKNVTIINNTTIINNNVTNITNNNINNNRTNNTRINNNARNNVYAAGPDPNEISRETGTVVRPIAITNTNRPGQQINNEHISLFRPRVNPTPSANNTNNSNTQQRIAPARFQTLNNLRPIANNPNNTTNPPANNVLEPPRNNERPANTSNNNSPFTRPTNNATSPVNNNAPANNANNTQQFNRPNNNNPVTTEKPNNPPGNVNAQPNTNHPNSNPQFNRSTNQPPANINSTIPANNNPNNNQARNNQNQANSQFNRNRQQQNQNQVRQQPNPQGRQNFNKPPLNKDLKPKDKPKDDKKQP